MKNRLSILALGDSYTCGEGVAREESWPFILANKIRSYQACNDPLVIAQTGWTTDELLAAIQINNIQTYFDYVFLLIGVNNQYRGYDISQFIKEFQQLSLYAIERANGKKERVGIISIPDYSVTPFGQSKQPRQTTYDLLLYNTLKRDISYSYGLNWIDITPISQMARNQTLLLTVDQLHPSKWMYKMWADEIWTRMFEKEKDQ